MDLGVPGAEVLLLLLELQGELRPQPSQVCRVTDDIGTQSYFAPVALVPPMPGTLWARMTWSKALFAVLLLNLIWVASLFLAPFTVPPRSFYEVDTGGANVLDFGSIWGTFPPYAQFVYTFGDIQCHQMFTRSFALNGNQMPIDARMTSMYVFATFGLIAAMFAAPAPTPGAVIVNGLPASVRRWFSRFRTEHVAALVITIGILPVAIDGFAQLLTPYESTNLTRVLTGIPCGFVGGLLIGAMLVSIRYIGVEIEAMRARAKANGRP